MKKLFLLFGAFFFMASVGLNANNYKLDEEKVNTLFENAVEVNINTIVSANNFASSMDYETTSITADTDQALVAWILCWVVGPFGIHRHYLGTKGSMWAIYTFTACGIFGIVPTVDWFVLLIDGIVNENIEKYVDNEKFFMWS